jgi:hypothetical protein
LRRIVVRRLAKPDEQIHKDYERAFLLEKTKLDRVMDIIHSLLGEHHNTTKHDHFEVSLSGQRREEMTSVEEVLELDNSRKSKIKRLLITCFASTEGAARPEHEIQLDFDGRTINKTKIIVSVRSDVAGWSDRALSELEEQVERTSLQDVPHRIALAFLVSSVAVFLLLLILSSLHVSSDFRQADVMWLRKGNVDRVEQILKQNRTITDEEMREISTMQLRNVLNIGTNSEPSEWTIRRKASVGIPLLIILVCAGYLVVRCYPRAVFLWGDEVEQYNKMLQTRRIVWNIIIGVIVVGVLSNFLFAGLVLGR